MSTPVPEHVRCFSRLAAALEGNAAPTMCPDGTFSDISACIDQIESAAQQVIGRLGLQLHFAHLRAMSRTSRSRALDSAYSERALLAAALT